MKKIRNISYAAFACFAITFSACSQNEDITPTLKGQEINATFTVGGVQTRVNTLEKVTNGRMMTILKYCSLQMTI